MWAVEGRRTKLRCWPCCYLERDKAAKAAVAARKLLREASVHLQPVPSSCVAHSESRIHSRFFDKFRECISSGGYSLSISQATSPKAAIRVERHRLRQTTRSSPRLSVFLLGTRR